MRFPLDLAPGIVSDETTFASPGQWVDGSNARPWHGKMQPIGGWAKAHATAVTGVCRNVLSWTDNSGVPNVAFGTHSKLMVLSDEALYDITPTGPGTGNIDSEEGVGYGTGGYGMGGYGGGFTEYWARTWSLATWGENLLASPRGYPIYVWENDTASVATEIANAPDTNMFMLVTPQRQVMVFGTEEEVSGDFNWLCIRWCDIEDYTDWTTSAANNAGEHILESEGKIVTARLLGPYIAIWTESSLHLAQFIGAPGETYRFEAVANNCGAAGPNAVIVVNQTAYWLTPDLQFYAWQFGTPPQPIPCPIRKDFKDNIDTVQITKVSATSVSEFNEIWWFYPDSRDGDENSRYVSFSLTDNAWFRGQMIRTAAIDSGPQRYPVFVAYDGYVYEHENGDDADGSALEWFVESGDFYISDAQRRVFVDGIWPDFDSQVGNVSLTIKAKDYPQSTARTKGPWTLAPGREKRDFAFETRIAAVKFAGSAAGTFARIGKPTFGGRLAGQF